jgi:hypothetical protein
MLKDVNVYDLYRTNYGGDQVQTMVDGTEKKREGRLASTIVDGQERVYKRGHTVGERTPWLK